jgi:hypothetical protein
MRSTALPAKLAPITAATADYSNRRQFPYVP